MTEILKSVGRWLALNCLVALLCACYSLAGLDMSVEGRHKMWIEDKQNLIGQSVYGCPYWYCIDHQRFDLFLGESDLINGNKERGYRYGRFDANNLKLFPQCHYFYEYNVKTGVIVSFRFEESKRFACRISGA